MAKGIWLRRHLRRLGIDVVRARPNTVDLLRGYDIRTVLDVGANEGQFARELRRWGYRGRVVSFEPLAAPFRDLEAKARDDQEWEAHHVGLGSYDGEATIHVSELSVFSSLLPSLPRLHAFDSRSASVREETIRLQQLDTVFPSLSLPEGNVYLKVDTQGSEAEVLRGAEQSLTAITAVQLEVSLQPLYEGETLLPELVEQMQARGFGLVSAEPVVFHPETHALLQMDCVFVRSGSEAT
jgi:FkbM family methyltransferase